MIRRLKKEVLHQLPGKIKQKIAVEVSEDSKAAIKQEMMAWRQRDRFFRGESNENVEGNANFLSAFKLTGQAKIPAVSDFVATLLDNNCKFLLFAYHLSVLDAIEQ